VSDAVASRSKNDEGPGKKTSAIAFDSAVIGH
jgi:hypothetical protein